MGCGSIGPLGGMSITTKKSDHEGKTTDNDPGFADVFIGLFATMATIIIWWVIGHAVIPVVIGLLAPAIFIGPLFYGRYYWSNKPIKRYRKLTPEQREIIQRRLSGCRLLTPTEIARIKRRLSDL